MSYDFWKADILTKRVFQADNFDHFPFGKLRPYGQPGQMPIGNFFVALLIE